MNKEFQALGIIHFINGILNQDLVIFMPVIIMFVSGK